MVFCEYLIHLPSEELFSFAGLWNSWKDNQTGQTFHTYTTLTTEANALMSVVHNSKKRMPVFINPKAEKEWVANGKLHMFNDFLQADPLQTTYLVS